MKDTCVVLLNLTQSFPFHPTEMFLISWPFLQRYSTHFTNIKKSRNSVHWLFQQTVINIISIEITEELIAECIGAV